jgi:YVTN family beta-propeller protein
MKCSFKSALCAALLFATVDGVAGDLFDPLKTVNPYAMDGVLVPSNQILTPAGLQVELPELRPQVIALSPDGAILVTSGKTHELIVLNPINGNVLQRVLLPEEGRKAAQPGAISSHILLPDKEGQVSFTGLVFSHDGSRIYLSNVNGSIKVFAVEPGHKVVPLYSIPLPAPEGAHRTKDIPTGLAISLDGRRLYVALNISNRLLEIDLLSRKVLRQFEVGNAPYDVVLVGAKAYVSNWGGRRPDSRSLTGPIGIGASVRVDPVRFIANEGSVSIVNLESGIVTSEILVGLHACALAVTPDEKQVVVANANSDTISVIEVATDHVIDTISLAWHPNAFFGASPNALQFDPSGKTLYVCNGTQNAVAVVAYRPHGSKLKGLIPTGWFPGAIAYDAKRRSIYVANIKGIGSGRRFPAGKETFKSNQFNGTLSLIPLPDRSALKRQTGIVFRNCRRAVLEAARLPARPNIAAKPVPERAGEPSLIKHVIYVIKENRTYDQVLGDIPEGRGKPDLCIFGDHFTPNQHKICREFVLLDNTHCSGILSADGHQWADTAFATDYMEKSFAGFPRSYPDGMEDKDVDALAYSPTGFIWDNALAHHKTLRDYGEFTIGITGWSQPGKKKGPHFTDFYNDFVNGTTHTRVSSRAAIQSLRPYICTNTIGWDLDVPDQYRAAEFITELEQFEKAGKLPELIIVCLPNDHTSGTAVGAPTPAAQVADNDLAFGKIVDAVSHSIFWKDTCIFAIEDDPQAGFDHISSYRTTAYVVSPYTKRHAVVSHNYNQPSLLRTMELMLGLPPMNQMDAGANPMFACFTSQPDFTPFDSVLNNVPLDQMNPKPSAIVDPVQRHYAIASGKLPLEDADDCPEDLLNRILWNAQKGNAPYPSWAISEKVGPRRRD